MNLYNMVNSYIQIMSEILYGSFDNKDKMTKRFDKLLQLIYDLRRIQLHL